MVFGFEFNSPILIYYAGGFEDIEKTRSKLEEISRGHCEEGSLATETIYCLDDEKFDVLERYEIELKNGKRIMKNLN